ncbi:MAG: DUF2752 domain-containing protein [Acholeplasmatales bacterium]|nr:DUF2752 domain-containing protein [Acholeplasmatales bacterium]
MKIIRTPLTFINKNWAILMMILIYLTSATLLLGEACIFKIVFGVPCPACGFTRAWEHFFVLDFKGAFEYHPLFWLFPVVFIIILYKDDFKLLNRIYSCMAFWIVVLVSVVGCYILRWIFVYPNEPMDLNRDSLLFTVIHLFKKIFGLI